MSERTWNGTAFLFLSTTGSSTGIGKFIERMKTPTPEQLWEALLWLHVQMVPSPVDYHNTREPLISKIPPKTNSSKGTYGEN